MIGRTVVTRMFGHEFAGIVEAVGDRVTNVKAGDHVSGKAMSSAAYAKRAAPAMPMSARIRAASITLPGCFGEYAVLRASNVIRNDPKLPFEIACLQDPLGNAVQTVLAGDIVGKSVAVVGVGPIGLMAIAVAKACGSGTIIAVDINPYRLEMAKTMGRMSSSTARK